MIEFVKIEWWKVLFIADLNHTHYHITPFQIPEDKSVEPSAKVYDIIADKSE